MSENFEQIGIKNKKVTEIVLKQEEKISLLLLYKNQFLAYIQELHLVNSFQNLKEIHKILEKKTNI